MRYTSYLSRIGDTLRFAVLAALLLFTACAAPKGLSSPDRLIERGLAAAGKEDWPKALDYFEKAQAVAPHAPLNAFNLGLAHAKSGHDLVAMAWFHTYLAAMPDAANAAQLRSEIRRLEASAEAKIKHVLSQALAAAEQLPDIRPEGFSIPKKPDAIDDLALHYARAGDMEGVDDVVRRAQEAARRVDSKHEISEYRIERKYLYFAEKLAEAGDIEAAEALLEKHPPKRPPVDVWEGLLRAYAERNDIAGLRRTLEKIPEDKRGSEDYLGPLADIYIRTGQLEAAKKLAYKARERHEIRNLLSKVAYHLLDAGKLKEMRKIAREAAGYDDWVHALTLAGDVNQALQRMREADDSGFMPSHNEMALADMTNVLVRLDDLPNARAAAKLAHKRAPARDKGGGRYSLLADAYVLYGEGKTKAAIAKVKKASDLLQPNSDLYNAGFCNVLLPTDIALGRRLGAAEQLVHALAPPEEQVQWYRRIAGGYAARGDRDNANRLIGLAADMEMTVRGGWRPKSPAQENRVDAWIALARSFSKFSIYVDLQKEITEIKNKAGTGCAMCDIEYVPRNIAGLANWWADGLFKIRALEKRFAMQAAGGG